MLLSRARQAEQVPKSPLEADFFTLSLLVANKPGVLGRVALVFSRRGFNIESLNVTHTLDHRFSRMVIASRGDAKQLDDIAKQTRNLIDVLHFSILSAAKGAATAVTQSVTVELLPGAKRVVLGIIEEFRYRIIDFSNSSIKVEAPNLDSEYEAFIQMIKHYGKIQTQQPGGK